MTNSNNINKREVPLTRKVKYMLPIIVLPFVIGLAYAISIMYPYKEEEKPVTVKDFNSELPQPNLGKEKNKLEASLENIRSEAQSKQIKGLDNIDSTNFREDVPIQEEIESPITDNSLIENDDNSEKEALDALRKKYFGEQNIREPKSEQMDELAALKAQIAHLDSLQKGLIKQQKEEEQQQDDILVATKASDVQNTNFNTIKADKKEMFISAILDEAETVVSGSRIRIRLLDDIFIGDYLFKKGSYLYGIVGGFTEQRVFVDIESVLYNSNEILKTKLTIYDNDGIKGLYVPNSDFRDMIRKAGSQAASQSVTINSSDANQLERILGQMSQDVYRSITQAVSKKIRQNKAKFKYATIIYLINEDKDAENKNNNNTL